MGSKREVPIGLKAAVGRSGAFAAAALAISMCLIYGSRSSIVAFYHLHRTVVL